MANFNKTGIIWRLLQRIIFIYMFHNSKKILLNHALVKNDGQAIRWLKNDIKYFHESLKTQVKTIRIEAELNKLPNLGSKIMVELTILTIGAYKALLTLDIKPSSARAIVADMGWKIYASQLRFASLPFRLTSRDPSKRLHKTIGLLLRFPFTKSKPPGYEVKSFSKNGDIYTYFTHCPPQTFVRRLIAKQGDNGELLAFSQSWCQYDWPGADIIAGDGQRNHYTRNKTLSAGDDVCNMCWKRQGVKTQREWKGRD